MDAVIQGLDAFHVVGMLYHGRNDKGQIPELWQRFWPRHGEIADRLDPGVSFGVLDHFDAGSRTFDYLAGLKVATAANPPDGMTAVFIPAQTYAVFECTLPTLMDTMRSIYEDWLPASPYTRAAGPEFEQYDHRFRPDEGFLEMSVYIPVISS